MADDPKFAFASMATGYADEAKIVHVGESVGGYRVTGIEWDRVWVQGAKGRCAVGMHLGVREAEAGVDQEAAAQDYAKLPWVLPHEITSGMFKRSEMDWELTETAIAKLYERGADVFAGLRVRVAKNGEEIVGLELHDVRLDSFLERLGILSGDVLSKIADQPVTSAEDVSRMLDEVRGESELVVDFVRGGED
jgi:membrane-associated protease RseP (regulator of RpoE activity)